MEGFIRERITKHHIEGEREGMRNGDSPFAFRLLGTAIRLSSGQGGGKMPRLAIRRQGKVALES